MGEASIAVIVPAAGSGSRMGGERKQFRRLGDHPLVIETLRVFDRHEAVGLLIVAAPLLDHSALRDALAAVAFRTPVVLAPGGATRQSSVRAGLDHTPPDVDIVLVHDGVRPFVTQAAIDRVIAAIREAGAAAVAVEATDTLRRGADGMFGETVSREGLYRMQTPQGARRDWLVEAHASALRDGVDATDDVALLQRIGRSVRRVEGDPLNFKVTTPADWELAIRIFSSRSL
jgi:2-C-methyl-D-erythritol 4-phosphate cytidylyltransferase